MIRRAALALAGLAILTLGAVPADAQEPVDLLIITGDQGHDWPATTKALEEFLPKGGRINVHVTKTPAKDLTDENLKKYDVFLLNYKETKPTDETKWTDSNMQALMKLYPQPVQQSGVEFLPVELPRRPRV